MQHKKRPSCMLQWMLWQPGLAPGQSADSASGLRLPVSRLPAQWPSLGWCHVKQLPLSSRCGDGNFHQEVCADWCCLACGYGLSCGYGISFQQKGFVDWCPLVCCGWLKGRCLHHVFAKAICMNCVFCHLESVPPDVLFCTAVCNRGTRHLVATCLSNTVCSTVALQKSKFTWCKQRRALPYCNLPSRQPEISVLCPFALQKLTDCSLLTRLLCHAQFSTAAVHAAEEQREAASKEAKRQELFPSLSSSSTPTRPAQSTGESCPISHSLSVIPNQSSTCLAVVCLWCLLHKSLTNSLAYNCLTT